MEVCITYSIIAVCRRPGWIHRLLPTGAKARRKLVYGGAATGQKLQRSSDDHRYCLVCCRAWLPSNKLLGIAEPVDTTTPARFPRPPPPYSQAICLDAVFPHSLILSPGEHFAAGLFVAVPPSLRGKAVVRSLEISLHRTTTARDGSSVRIDRSAWPIWSVRGRIPLQHGRVSIACGQISDVPGDRSKAYRLHIPNFVPALPSFATCSLSRVYFLHIQMGISVTGMSATHYIETSVDVDMPGPPPAYVDSIDRAC